MKFTSKYLGFSSSIINNVPNFISDQNKLDETFVEKLVTQIIKNVQLKIKDIHVRYEDSITNPRAPFSFGFTLHNLSVHTTDENWRQTVIQEAVTKIFKVTIFF